MRTVGTFLLITFLFLFGQYIAAQEEVSVKENIAKLEEKKVEVTNLEKEALKKEVEDINQKLDKEEITFERAQTLKKNAAEKRALNIENKLAIIDNQIALLQRNGNYNLNSETSSLELAIGGKDESGNLLFGVQYKSGNEKNTVYDRRTYGDPVIAFGLNNAIIEGTSIEDTPYKIGGSRFFEIGWAWRTRVFKNSNFMRLHYGVSFQFNGLKPKDNEYFVLNNGVAELDEFPQELDKSKFRMDNLVFPLHFEFGPSKLTQSEDKIRYDIHNQFRVGLGGYAGLNLGARQKLKYELDGENVKDKIKRDYNTSSFVYGLSAYAGFDSVQLYLKYDLNPIFQDAPVEQRNISLGLRFDLD
ncbi:hypothetical protein D1013_05530 [Euzebyella marina]|uniref:PorT family protein n=1 Tax=Euzebyella marina TaxID=1761453 RepID=A0A3G2L3L3_9FLAO|nr:hypothetical protein [Euzebyella marina]AYN66870.1 hypothetical protein D1013_05530 [Euzebyella marina]